MGTAAGAALGPPGARLGPPRLAATRTGPAPAAQVKASGMESFFCWTKAWSASSTAGSMAGAW